MNIKTVSRISLLALVLSGCAGMSKPEMPEERYVGMAKNIAHTDQCIQQKYFSSEESINVMDTMGRVLNSWNYDYVKLSNLIAGVNAVVSEPICNKIRIDLQLARLKQDQARQDQVSQNQPTPVLVNPPRTTSCSRVGPQMLCSSF